MSIEKCAVCGDTDGMPCTLKGCEFATLSPAHIEDEREACERWIRQQIGMPSHIAMDWEAPLARYAWLAWKARAALSAPPAAGWTRAEQHDDISGDFEGYCWIDGRTGQRHWLPHGMNPNEKEPTRTNGGPRRCLFAPEGWACIKQAQHEGPCMAVKLTEGECHATSPAAGVPDAAAWETRCTTERRFSINQCSAEERARHWREQGRAGVEVRALVYAAPTPPASEQQRGAVQEVMEQCAKLCEERRDYYNGGDDDGPDSQRGGACQNCADVIRYRMSLNPYPAKGEAAGKSGKARDA